MEIVTSVRIILPKKVEKDKLKILKEYLELLLVKYDVRENTIVKQFSISIIDKKQNVWIYQIDIKIETSKDEYTKEWYSNIRLNRIYNAITELKEFTQKLSEEVIINVIHSESNIHSRG